MKCANGCGKELDSGDSADVCYPCRTKFSKPDTGHSAGSCWFPSAPIYGPTGWICPVCGRGNAPGITICPCKPLPPNGYTITWR